MFDVVPCLSECVQQYASMQSARDGAGTCERASQRRSGRERRVSVHVSRVCVGRASAIDHAIDIGHTGHGGADTDTTFFPKNEKKPFHRRYNCTASLRLSLYSETNFASQALLEDRTRAHCASHARNERRGWTVRW